MSYIPYTPIERQQIAVLAELGKSTPAIARALGITIERVYNQQVLADARQVAGIRNREDVARLFGVNPKAPIYWQERGWLPRRVRNGAQAAREGRRPKKAHHLFTDDHIEAFVRNRQTWPAWEPHRITDPAWRELAADVRAAAGGYWMTTQQVSDHVNYRYTTVLGWRDRFPSDATVKYGSAVFWWSAAVAAFVPPDVARYAR